MITSLAIMIDYLYDGRMPKIWSYGYINLDVITQTVDEWPVKGGAVRTDNIAASFEGVERVFAIQAGREIRVMVNHDLVSDAQAEQLAINISKKIQNEMQYPGQIKVTVIREVRSVSYAK